jgi:hypothetical protein
MVLGDTIRRILRRPDALPQHQAYRQRRADRRKPASLAAPVLQPPTLIARDDFGTKPVVASYVIELDQKSDFDLIDLKSESDRRTGPDHAGSPARLKRLARRKSDGRCGRTNPS